MMIGLGKSYRRDDPTALPIPDGLHGVNESFARDLSTGAFQTLHNQFAEDISVETVAIQLLVRIVPLSSSSGIPPRRVVGPFQDQDRGIGRWFLHRSPPGILRCS